MNITVFYYQILQVRVAYHIEKFSSSNEENGMKTRILSGLVVDRYGKNCHIVHVGLLMNVRMHENKTANRKSKCHWSTVSDAAPTLIDHFVNVSCVLAWNGLHVSTLHSVGYVE